MDDKRNRGQPDRSLINTHEPWEVEYWSKKFGVSPEKLKETVHKVGPSKEAVRKALHQ
jgi:hypothetical protein